MSFSDTERARILETARANMDRLANFQPVARDVHAADWVVPELELEPPERVLDTQPFDMWAEIDKRIAAAVAGEREFSRGVLAQLIARLRDETDEIVGQLRVINDQRLATITELTTKLAALAEQMHALRIEHADARAEVSQMRDALPNAFARRSVN